MAGEVRYAIRAVELWATIDGVVHPAVAAHIRYGLNEIPRAAVSLAVGRSLDTGAAAPIHFQLDAIEESKPLEVWGRFEPHYKSDQGVSDLGIPGGAVKLFSGQTGNAATAGNGPSLSMTINGNGWLHDLTESSCLSKSSHPGNPSYFTAGALMPAPGAGAKTLTLATSADEYISTENVTTDLWGAALKPFMLYLAGQDAFVADEVGLEGSGANDAAKAALEKIGGMPLALDMDVNEAADLPYAIAEDISLSLGSEQGMAQLTFWDVLIAGLSADYSFALVPRVDDALIVPYVAAYRGDNGAPFVDIGRDQANVTQIQRATPHLMRSMSILSSVASRSGADLSDRDGPSASQLGIGGFYEARDKGQHRIEQAPRWMSQLIVPSRYSEESTGALEAPVATAIQPSGAKQRGSGRRTKKDKQRAATPVVKSLLDRRARARFVDENLRYRQGVVGGPFRLDIAPGSVVRFAPVQERGLGPSDQLAARFFGTVHRVDLSISVEQGGCSTVLYLGQVRRERDNRDPWNSIDRHPLYRQVYAGAPLVV